MSYRAKGIILILLSVAIVALASQGATPEERDATVALFLFPLGISLVCSGGSPLHVGGDRHER